MRFAYSSGGGFCSACSSPLIEAEGAESEVEEAEAEVKAQEAGGGRGGKGGYIPGVTNEPGATMSVRMLDGRTSAERVSV